MAVRLASNKIVQGASAKLCHRLRQRLVRRYAMQCAVYIFTELCPVRGRGNKHRVFAMQSFRDLVGNSSVGVDKIVVLIEYLFDGVEACFAIDGI